MSKELQNMGKAEYPCISSYNSIFPSEQMFSEGYSMPQQNPMKFTIKEDSKDKDRDKSVNSQFASPKSSRDVKAIRKSAVLKKTRQKCTYTLQ